MKDSKAEPALTTVAVWDVPTRLFHWLLVLLVAVNLYTGNVGGVAEMDWHMRSGYAILTLVLFRLAWGFAGSRQSRFRSFVRGPRQVITYARGLISGAHQPAVGHNPMGGWSVVALLLCLMVQATTGLFADDAILTQGPLADQVSPATSKLLTGIHELNAKILYALIAVHLAAITYYAIVPRENLVRAMVTGSKPLPAGLAGDDRFVNPLRAVALLLLAAAVVWWVVDR